jgi:hypothetical protein
VAGKSGYPKSLAIGLSSTVLMRPQRMKAEWFTNSDDDGMLHSGRQRWSEAVAVWSRGGESSDVHEEGAKWRRASSVRGTRGDKLPVHVGW